MISQIIPYGGVIYWLLLFSGIIITTLFALKQKDALPPTITIALTLLFSFGFTSYKPEVIEVALGFFAYLTIGIIYSIYRWSRLVYHIKIFVHNIGSLKDDEILCRLVSQAFSPNDTNGCVSLPPDPLDFKTRILMWILFWWCFSLFSFIGVLHQWVSTSIWKMLAKLSGSIYDR